MRCQSAFSILIVAVLPELLRLAAGSGIGGPPPPGQMGAYGQHPRAPMNPPAYLPHSQTHPGQHYPESDMESEGYDSESQYSEYSIPPSPGNRGLHGPGAYPPGPPGGAYGGPPPRPGGGYGSASPRPGGGYGSASPRPGGGYMSPPPQQRGGYGRSPARSEVSFGSPPPNQVGSTGRGMPMGYNDHQGSYGSAHSSPHSENRGHGTIPSSPRPQSQNAPPRQIKTVDGKTPWEEVVRIFPHAAHYEDDRK